MDFLLEYLAPIIAFVIWALSHFLSNRNNDADDRPTYTAEEQDEETRRIQEEIRRKIAERRQPQQPTPPPLHAPYAPSEPARPVTSPLTRPAEPTTTRSGPAPRDFLAELAQQEKRLLETRRLAEEARNKARRTAQAQSAPSPYQMTSARMSPRRDSVMAALSNPESVRQAVLLQEILGSPVALRQNGRTGPLWDN